MSLRLPQNLSSGTMPDTGVSAFESELLAEKAAALGRAGRKLEQCLAAFRSHHDSARREGLLFAAAEAAYNYIIQRELCGQADHRAIVEDYQIPREVMVRVGARRRGES